MGLLPDTENCGLRMRRECRERFPRHRLQRKPLVSDPSMHHGTCVTHVLWCMPWSLTRRWRGKRAWHSRCMRNPQCCVSGRRRIGLRHSLVTWGNAQKGSPRSTTYWHHMERWRMGLQIMATINFRLALPSLNFPDKIIANERPFSNMVSDGLPASVRAFFIA